MCPKIPKNTDCCEVSGRKKKFWRSGRNWTTTPPHVSRGDPCMSRGGQAVWRRRVLTSAVVMRAHVHRLLTDRHSQRRSCDAESSKPLGCGWLPSIQGQMAWELIQQFSFLPILAEYFDLWRTIRPGIERAPKSRIARENLSRKHKLEAARRRLKS